MRKLIPSILSVPVVLLTFYCMPLISQASCAPGSHSLEFKPGTEATCTEDGVKGYYECKICHDLFDDENATKALSKDGLVISASHTYEPEHDVVLIKKRATLKNNGCIKHQCVECGAYGEDVIIPKVGKIQLSFSSVTYNGKSRKPTVTVYDANGSELKGYDKYDVEGSQYKVTYPTSSKKVGRYSVKITFMNFYSGTVTKTYDIKPKGTKITRLSPAKKRLTVRWKKQSDQTDGYQIKYGISSDFKKSKLETVSGTRVTSKTISRLKSGKNYYVKMRTYKKIKSGKKTVKLYSDWSKVKKVTVK
ncbi:MAG: hypothetical protein MR867_00310 [Eubacterium sp.]|nr:hypothetical protein [Eubacterium sp.]